MNFFKYLVFTALLFFLPFLMTGCNQSNKMTEISLSVVSPDTTTQNFQNSEVRLMVEKGIVLERVRDIFRVVRENELCQGIDVNNELLDRAYCSKAWNKLLMAVRRKEYNSCTLFFEVNYWAMTHYPVFVTFDDFEVTRVTISDDKKTASVDYVTYELDAYNPARIDLVFEDGRWVIDNFYDMRNMLNVRQSMREYLRNDFI